SGCEAVPYSSERSECKSRQASKDSLCKSFGCELGGAEKALKELEQKRKSLAEARSRNNQAAIPALEKHVTRLEAELKRLKSDAEAKINRCDACIKAREEVQRVFTRVRTKVKGETDPALKPYIDKLVAHFDKGAQDHVKPINDV